MRALPATLVAGLLLVSACAAPVPGPSAAGPRVVRVTAHRFEYEPARLVLKRGEPVELELVSLDCRHGFAAPELGLRSDITPGAPAHIRFVPEHAGTYPFHCDVFCGEGHEDMSGEIVVED